MLANIEFYTTADNELQSII